MENEKPYIEQYFHYLTGLDGIKPRTKDDELFRKKTKQQIEYRDKHYTDLLKHFLYVTRIRNWIREIFKWLFLAAIIVFIFILIGIVKNVINEYLFGANKEMNDAIPFLITSIIGLVSTIIVIPVTITKYLFNSEEDKNITNVILHTQEHDIDNRNWTDKSSSKDILKKKNK